MLRANQDEDIIQINNNVKNPCNRQRNNMHLVRKVKTLEVVESVNSAKHMTKNNDDT